LIKIKLQTGDENMYKRILIPTDGSDLSEKAIEHSIALAKVLGAKITALTVLEPFHVSAFEPSMASSTRSMLLQLPRHLDVARNAAKVPGALPGNCRASPPHLASVLI
jgi:nucleotide-binding universal stress UspA family protein